MTVNELIVFNLKEASRWRSKARNDIEVEKSKHMADIHSEIALFLERYKVVAKALELMAISYDKVQPDTCSLCECRKFCSKYSTKSCVENAINYFMEKAREEL